MECWLAGWPAAEVGTGFSSREMYTVSRMAGLYKMRDTCSVWSCRVPTSSWQCTSRIPGGHTAMDAV